MFQYYHTRSRKRKYWSEAVTAQPFDRSLSHRLDALIFLVEHENRRFVRWLLRCYKSALESQVQR
jgi:hypothetical protein